MDNRKSTPKPSFVNLVRKHIRNIPPYTPGKSIEELKREIGIARPIKLASNENPLGPSPRAVDAIARTMGRLHRYPDDTARDLREKIGAHWNLSPEHVVLGNGSDEILAMAMQILLDPGDHVVVPYPSFLMYEIAARTFGAEISRVALNDFVLDPPAMLRAIRENTKLMVLCQPNNPTGTALSRDAFEDFLERVPPEIPLLVDEAYGEFIRDPQAFRARQYLERVPQMLILRTFSKAYGLAGIRIGYGIAQPEMIRYLERVRPPFNTNSLAQAAALAALDDREFLERTRKLAWSELDYLYGEMNRLGLFYVPSQTNFLVIRVDNGKTVYERLLHKGVIVRPMDGYGLPEWIRVNVGIREENMRFVEALEQVLHTAPAS